MKIKENRNTCQRTFTGSMCMQTIDQRRGRARLNARRERAPSTPGRLGYWVQVVNGSGWSYWARLSSTAGWNRYQKGIRQRHHNSRHQISIQLNSYHNEDTKLQSSASKRGWRNLYSDCAFATRLPDFREDSWRALRMAKEPLKAL